jgi:hypothetical protein
MWSKRDATAWTMARLTRHIVGTCVRGELGTLEKMPDRSPLRALTTCATLLTAAYLSLSRLSGNLSNKWHMRRMLRCIVPFIWRGRAELGSPRARAPWSNLTRKELPTWALEPATSPQGLPRGARLWLAAVRQLRDQSAFQ